MDNEKPLTAEEVEALLTSPDYADKADQDYLDLSASQRAHYRTNPQMRSPGRPKLDVQRQREQTMLEPEIVAQVDLWAKFEKLTRSAMYRLLILEALKARA